MFTFYIIINFIAIINKTTTTTTPKPIIPTKLLTTHTYNKLINAKTHTLINNKQNIITYIFI